MHIVLYGLLGIAAFITLLLLVAAGRPKTFKVTRETTVAAPAATIFPNVDTLTRWAPWSPWEKIDPGMKRTFEGPAAGPGATYAWDGNKKVGSGRMTVLESRSPELVRVKLEFFRPMQNTCEAVFTFTPAAGGTTVTWSMTGPLNLIGRVFHLVINCDKMIGGDFEKGLAELKRISEQAPKPAVATS